MAVRRPAEYTRSLNSEEGGPGWGRKEGRKRGSGVESTVQSFLPPGVQPTNGIALTPSSFLFFLSSRAPASSETPKEKVLGAWWMLSATMHNLKGKAKHSITIHNPLPVPGGSPVQVGSVFINHHRFSFLIKKKIIIVFGKACHAGRASKGTTEKARHSSSSRRLRWAGHTILFCFVAETGCEENRAGLVSWACAQAAHPGSSGFIPGS